MLVHIFPVAMQLAPSGAPYYGRFPSEDSVLQGAGEGAAWQAIGPRVGNSDVPCLSSRRCAALE